MAIEHADFEGVERLALVLGAEIVSTFGKPELVKLGHCKLIEEVMIGEDQVSNSCHVSHNDGGDMNCGDILVVRMVVMFMVVIVLYGAHDDGGVMMVVIYWWWW